MHSLSYLIIEYLEYIPDHYHFWLCGYLQEYSIQQEILDIFLIYITAATLRAVRGSIWHRLIAGPYTCGDVRFGNLICVPTPHSPV